MTAAHYFDGLSIVNGELIYIWSIPAPCVCVCVVMFPSNVIGLGEAILSCKDRILKSV